MLSRSARGRVIRNVQKKTTPPAASLPLARPTSRRKRAGLSTVSGESGNERLPSPKRLLFVLSFDPNDAPMRPLNSVFIGAWSKTGSCAKNLKSAPGASLVGTSPVLPRSQHELSLKSCKLVSQSVTHSEVLLIAIAHIPAFEWYQIVRSTPPKCGPARSVCKRLELAGAPRIRIP